MCFVTRNAARKEIEELFFIHGAGRTAVGASYLVGQNLQSGQGVYRSILANHQVAVALVGVCVVGTRSHIDVAGKG